MEENDDWVAKVEEDPLLFSAHKKKGARLKRNRRVIYPWSCQREVSRLIAAVQKRPPLWDCGSREYKMANKKIDCWKKVADELGIPEVDANEARNKWNIVRSLFKANLGKFRARKSEQSAADVGIISWVHFSEMMFIESAEVVQSSTSDSTMALEGAYTDTSLLDEFRQASHSHKKRKKSRTMSPALPTPSPSASPPTSSNFKRKRMKGLAAQVSPSLHTQGGGDRLTSFGQLVERNLRSLPHNESLQLEGRIMTLMYDFLASRK